MKFKLAIERDMDTGSLCEYLDTGSLSEYYFNENLCIHTGGHCNGDLTHRPINCPLMEYELMYKGYKARISSEVIELHGIVTNMRDVINFETDDPSKVKEEFEESVDCYLDYCKEKGIDPETPKDKMAGFKAHSEKQGEFLFSEKRISILASGIQYGKTTAGVAWRKKQTILRKSKKSLKNR